MTRIMLGLLAVLAIGIMTMPVGHASQGIAYRADLTITYPNSVNTGDTFTIDFIFDPLYSYSVDEIVNNESARYHLNMPSEFIVHTEFDKKRMTHVDKYEKHGMYIYRNNFTVDNIEGDKLTGSISVTLNQDLVHSIDKILLRGGLSPVGITVEKTETGVKFSDWNDEKLRSVHDDENRYSINDSTTFDFETYVPRERKAVNGASDWLAKCITTQPFTVQVACFKAVNGASDWLAKCITETEWNEIRKNNRELKKYDSPGCVIFDPILYLPAHAWECYAEFLRQIQNDFDLTDVRYYLQNDDYFSQEFIDDYLIAYPEFRIQSFDVSPYHQMKMGVPIVEIQCGVDKILMESKSGKPYCLSEDTADKLADRGFSIVTLKENIEINYDDTKDSSSPSGSAEIQLEKTMPIFLSNNTITKTNYNGTLGVIGELGSYTYFWPKLNITFPEQAIIGEPFDVVMDYTYILPEDDGTYSDHGINADRHEQCMAEWCERHDIEVAMPTFIDYLNDDAVYLREVHDPRHLPVRTWHVYGIDPPFDNTQPLQETFTFVINEPDIDYRYGFISIDFNRDRPADFYFNATQNGIIYFDDELMQSLGEGPGQLRDRPRTVTGITSEMRVGTVPVYDPPKEIWEDLKDHMLHLDANDWLDGMTIRESLEDHPQMNQSWIDEFLKFYPELDTQSFNPVLHWILPQAYGQEVLTSMVFSQISNTDPDGGSSFLHGATVCAEIMSPLQQLNDGIENNMIQCNTDKILMESKSGKPYCLSEDTAVKLADRGFSVVVLKENIEISHP